ncbi:hypothetical protein BSKO_06478 [Bryopsis sp. KO-2023]|nr:hypothetical protein BSKO_06478 [Bryopsis sp. KO-2023]
MGGIGVPAVGHRAHPSRMPHFTWTPCAHIKQCGELRNVCRIERIRRSVHAAKSSSRPQASIKTAKFGGDGERNWWNMVGEIDMMSIWWAMPVSLAGPFLFSAPSIAASIDLQTIATLDFSDPWALLQLLLQNPIVTIILAGVLYYLIPRLTKLTIRFLVIPAVLFFVGSLTLSNPEGTVKFLEQSFNFVQGHPYQTSLVTLGVLGVLLSPYIIAFGAILVIVGGYQLIPPKLRPFAPEPIVKAERNLEFIEASTKKEISSLTALYGQSTKAVSDKVDRLLEPLGQAKTGVTSKVDSIVGTVEKNKDSVKSRIDSAIEVTGNTVGSVGRSVSGVSTTIREATKCTREPTPELRMECVNKQNERLRSEKDN